MSKIKWFLEGTSHFITMYIGKKWGQSFPMYFVCSFPRSGSTWLSEMLADYLNLPRPSHYIFPIGFSSIVHTHTAPRFGLKDCFYIYRDGRDCYLSFYKYLVKVLEEERASYKEYNFWKKKFNKGAYQDHFAENFAIFLEIHFQKKWHWGNHTQGWLESSKRNNNVILIKFEELRNSTFDVLANALEQRFGSYSIVTLEEAIKRQSIQIQKSRPEEQHRTFIRKGTSGDWKSYFDKTTADIFEYYGGETLINLGYEENYDWTKKFK